MGTLLEVCESSYIVTTKEIENIRIKEQLVRCVIVLGESFKIPSLC